MYKYSIRFKSKHTNQFIVMFDQILETDHVDNCMIRVAEIVEYFNLYDCIVYTEEII